MTGPPVITALSQAAPSRPAMAGGRAPERLDFGVKIG